MCHLQPCALEAALDVEPLVCLAAVENALVAAHPCGDEVERLDDFEAEFLALLVFRDGDVFNMTDETEVVDAGELLARLLWNVEGRMRRERTISFRQLVPQYRLFSSHPRLRANSRLLSLVCS
jgi:hypothetical protein